MANTTPARRTNRPKQSLPVRGGTIAPPPDATKRVQSVALLINRHKTGLQAFLTGLFDPQKMAALVFNAMRRTPQLANCTDESLLCAVYEAAVLKLEPNTYRQECFLIPRKNKGVMEATFQVGYQGAVKMAMRANTRVPLVQVRAQHVYMNDAFERIEAPYQRIEHVPHNGIDKGDWLGTYSSAEFEQRDGVEIPPIVEWLDMGQMSRIEAVALGVEIAGMTDIEVLKEVEAHRNTVLGRARSENKLWSVAKPWYTWRERQQRKSAIKRNCKNLPLPDDEARGFHLDDLASSLKDQQDSYALSQIIQDGSSPGYVQVPRGMPQPDDHDDAGTDDDDQSSSEEKVADLAQLLKEADPTAANVIDELVANSPDADSCLRELRKVEARIQQRKDDK